MTVFWFQPRSELQGTRKAAAAQAASDRHSRQSTAPVSSAIAPLMTAPQGSTAPLAIDWAKEARLAAARQIDADEAAARAALAFTHPTAPGSLAARIPRSPEFHWSHAHTHRIESIPGGGYIINLTDSCALVVTLMLMPVCKLGTIEPRGDLLLHMDDPPLLGEWQRELP